MSNMSKQQRPTTRDTEDDLMRFQEDFLSSGSSTSATVVNRRSTPRDVIHLPDDGRTASTPSTSGGLSPKAKKAKGEKDPSEVLDDYERTHHVGGVLANITERDTSHSTARMPIAVAGSGFPKPLAVDRSRSVCARGGGKKKSLFAQQFDRQHGKAEKSSKPPLELSKHDHSMLVSGSGLPVPAGSSQEEARRIHEENVAKIASMSPEEILVEQHRLSAALGPDVLEFIRKRRVGGAQKTAGGAIGQTADDVTDVAEERHVRFAPKVEIHDESGAEIKKAVPGVVDMEAEEARDWVHMDKVEDEKMEWMTELPDDHAKRTELQKSCPARFSFDGSLISPEESCSIPAHVGLHHHGEEPDAAGYTLSELFVLARSQMPQQQALALDTLAAVVRKGLRGSYAQHLDTDVVSILLEAGLPLILRWALDDSRVSVYCGALDGLRALLVNEHDQAASDFVAASFPSLGIEALAVPEDASGDAGDEEQEDPTDEEQIASDLIKGLLKTNLLPRLRYLLEVCSLPSSAITAVFGILLRVSQHSLQASADIAKCPRLLSTILDIFLPVSWTGEGPVAAGYGYPLVAAVQLVNSLCRSGRYLAAQIVSKYDLMSRIGRYLSVPASDLGLAGNQCEELQAAVWSLWQTITVYGQNCDFFTSMQESILEHLHRCLPGTGEHVNAAAAPAVVAVQTVGETDADGACRTADGDRSSLRHPAACGMRSASRMMALLESAVHVAAYRESELDAWRAEEKLLAESCPSIGPQLLGRQSEQSARREVWTKLSSHQVHAWYTDIDACLTGFLAATSGMTVESHAYVTLMSSLLSFAASYLSRLGSSQMSPVDLVENAERLFTHLSAVMKSAAFQRICQEARSAVACLRHTSASPPIASLPGRNGAPELATSALPACSLAFVCSLFKLVSSLRQIHKGLTEKVHSVFLQHPAVLDLVAAIMSHPLQVHHPLAAVERLTGCLLVKLAASVLVNLADCPPSLLVYHRLALQLLCRFKPGEESLVKELLSTVIFQPLFFRCNSVDVVNALARLSLTKSTLPGVSSGDALTAPIGSLPSIRATFLALLGTQSSPHSLWYSRVRHFPQPCLLPAVLISTQRASLLPIDWMFLPLLDAFANSTSPGRLHSESDNVPDRVCNAVSHCLQWVFLLETCQPHCVALLPVAVKVARLFCVFLVGANLFLQTDVQRSLVALLRLYTQSGFLPALQFDRPIPGLASFYDLYAALVAQYDAVSYGNELFASYVLLPQRRACPVSHRCLLWQDNDTVLQTITLTASQSPVPLLQYLQPVEEDTMLLQLYLQALARGIVRPGASLLYCIAVHHISMHLFGAGQTAAAASTVTRAMLSFLLTQKNMGVFHHVLTYKSANPVTLLGFDCHSAIPASRCLILAQEVKRSGLDSALSLAVKQLHPEVVEVACSLPA